MILHCIRYSTLILHYIRNSTWILYYIRYSTWIIPDGKREGETDKDINKRGREDFEQEKERKKERVRE